MEMSANIAGILFLIACVGFGFLLGRFIFPYKYKVVEVLRKPTEEELADMLEDKQLREEAAKLNQGFTKN